MVRPVRTPGGGSAGDGDGMEICETYFECGEAAEGFTQSDCEQLVFDCRGPLEASNPGYYDDQIDACLAAASCGEFDACFNQLLQACLDASGGSSCENDTIECNGDEISVCVDGQWEVYDCATICAEDGSGYDSCSYDEESGHDVCWCVGAGGDPATCELGVNAFCTCFDCTMDEAQTFYDECVAQGSDILTCFAEQVTDDSIACDTAIDLCAPA